jgi:hypothetical protein
MDQSLLNKTKNKNKDENIVIEINHDYILHQPKRKMRQKINIIL